MRVPRRATLLTVVWLTAMPLAASAQSAIAGVVKDSAGAVVPGVLVQASSPVLIERSRAAATDGLGQYRIENLRPGTYAVTFTRAGLRPAVREGIELAGSFTATVNAELSVGDIAELVTVTGETPIVDVHSARHEIVLAGDVLRAIPAARSYNALVPLVPGVTTSANDIVTGTSSTAFPIHGGRANEGRLLVDGLNVGSPPAGNSAATYVVDTGNAQEITFTTSGGLGEVETSGLLINVVSKSGSNSTRGSVFASGTAAALQSGNVTAELRQQGVVAATPFSHLYDVSGVVGGPIRQDRVWYFATAHTGGSKRDVTNVYYNANAGDSARWLYAPDFRRREYSDRTFENASGRLTWQLTPRNKLEALWDKQALCRACTGSTPGNSEPARVSPEATGVLGRPLDVVQAAWTSPITSRWLAEASVGGTYFGVGNFEREPNPTRSLIRVAEQCANGCPANGDIPGLVYRSQDFSTAHTGSYLWKASLSRVAGRQSLKVGYQHTLMTDDRTWETNDQHLTYRFDNGVPNQLTQSISPWVNDARAGWDAVFVQDQWTSHRLTLQGALRFDRARSWFPRQQEGPSRFLPNPIVIPETKGIDSYTDLTPRLGAAYDLFGTGRTAIKMNLGKYLEGVGISGIYGNTNPTLRLPQTTSVFGTAGVTRAWTDANGNFVPDCDLLNPAAQDLRTSGGDLCGVMSNTSFGTNVLTNNFDPQLLHGWGVRPSDWNVALAIQQQLGARSSVEVTYTRRSFRGFTVVDNLALQPADLTPFNIVAPSDPRLPGGGGYAVTGLYDVVPEKAGQVNNLVAGSDTYGRWFQRYSGLDINVSARIGRDFTLIGGTSTGQNVADNCEVRASLPELSTATTGTSVFGPGVGNSAVTPLNPYCHAAYGVHTQVRGLSSYIVPTIDVQLAATFQSKPGAMLAANYTASNAEVAPSLGRSLSGNAANVTVNLIEPGTLYGDRVNQLDLRVAKILKFGRSRTLVAIDIYNALNSSAVLTYNNAFVPGGAWLQPTAILTPRFIKFTAELDF